MKKTDYESVASAWIKKASSCGDKEEQYRALRCAAENYALGAVEARRGGKQEEADSMLKKGRSIMSAMRSLEKAFKKKGKSIDSILNPKELKLSSQELAQLGNVGVRYVVFAVLAIITLLASLTLVSFDITGYAILEQPRDNLGFIATGLFVLALAFVSFYFKSKKAFV